MVANVFTNTCNTSYPTRPHTSLQSALRTCKRRDEFQQGGPEGLGLCDFGKLFEDLEKHVKAKGFPYPERAAKIPLGCRWDPPRSTGFFWKLGVPHVNLHAK